VTSFRTNIIKSAREACDAVRTNMPPGTTLLHRPTGKQYVIGSKYGMRDFWLMAVGETKKGLVPARTIANEFEVIPE
jgi:hypothetical protein